MDRIPYPAHVPGELSGDRHGLDYFPQQRKLNRHITHLAPLPFLCCTFAGYFFYTLLLHASTPKDVHYRKLACVVHHRNGIVNNFSWVGKDGGSKLLKIMQIILP